MENAEISVHAEHEKSIAQGIQTIEGPEFSIPLVHSRNDSAVFRGIAGAAVCSGPTSLAGLLDLAPPAGHSKLRHDD